MSRLLGLLPTFRPHTLSVCRSFTQAAAFGSVDPVKKEPVDQVAKARTWLATLDLRALDALPDCLYKIGYSRSSGPGGQNVNKVSSKATLTCPASGLEEMLPSLVFDQVKKSRYWATNGHCLVIQSDEMRKQEDNARRCVEKMHELFVSAGKQCIPGETSPEQSAKVKKLDKKNNESRLKMKKLHSQKKSSRRTSGYD